MYQLTKHGGIVRLSDGAHIPQDPDNRDYAEFLESGEEAAPYVEPFDRVAAMARLKAVRTRILDALTGVAGRLDRRGDTTAAGQADSAAQALLDLPTHPLLLAAGNDDQFDKTALYLYRQIASACPASVQAAFIGAM